MQSLYTPGAKACSSAHPAEEWCVPCSYLFLLQRRHSYHSENCLTVFLWWQHLVHQINWIWPWCILVYVSLHIISLSSILHGYGVLTYFASWMFWTYLVLYVCTLITINFASNHSSMIASTKICSSIIDLLSTSFAYLLVRSNILQRPYFWPLLPPSTFRSSSNPKLLSLWCS